MCILKRFHQIPASSGIGILERSVVWYGVVWIHSREITAATMTMTPPPSQLELPVLLASSTYDGEKNLKPEASPGDQQQESSDTGNVIWVTILLC